MLLFSVRHRILLNLIPILALFSLAQATPTSEWMETEYVRAQFTGFADHVEPGTPYLLGLVLEHEEGWHTYWQTTATGYATSIQWDAPEGISVGPIQWATPKTYTVQNLTDYVYEGVTVLLMQVDVPETYTDSSLELGFTVDWLMCSDICIPGSVSGSLTLPVASGPASMAEAAASLQEKAMRNQPAAPGPYALKAWRQGPEAVTFEISGPSLPSDLYFFDATATFKPVASQPLRRIDPDTVRLSLELDPTAETVPETLNGVLGAQAGWPGLDGRPGIAVDLPLLSAPPAEADAATANLTLGLIALAFAGGLILNLMPCVFPVLGLKIMGFVGQAGSSRGRVVAHGLVFSAGVLLSFWVLAFALILLRSAGHQLGWGFQLQSPAFVLALLFLLFAFALNMSGLFEVGQSAVGVGSKLTAKSGLSGSFFSGVLATVVATPCAAPFLAPALGAALTLPPLASYTVFTFIALGLAGPYLLLSSFPALINKLPRPGPWMETFKQSMAFLLYATVAYLLWVIVGQLDPAAGYSPFSLLQVLLGLVGLALAGWIFGRWGAYHRPRQTRMIASFVAIMTAGVALGSAFTSLKQPDPEVTSIAWETWAPGKAEALAADGHVVYVDFTARWCVTCQTNKATILASGKVREVFKDPSVVTLKADWTNQDADISQALASFGRSAVPFNLIYGPGLEAPLILPEILTPGIVLEAMETAARKRPPSG
jgi:thiol:disulfide interchange protein DsbD